MYSESDLAGAVAAGVLTQPQADALRNHVAAERAAPSVDEEQFRLLTGFNDIFVAIAAALILVAVGWIGFYLGAQLVGFDPGNEHPRTLGIAAAVGAFAVAGVSWALAEVFTARRRMALPSILLLLGFAGGVFAGLSAIFVANAPWLAERFGIGLGDEVALRQLAGACAVIVGLLATGAAWLHWRRFMVPITVAVGAVAAVAVVAGLTALAAPGSERALHGVLFICGLATFVLAMRWDVSDLERRTRRSDVAFWLHLAAAPLIAHPVFHLLGVLDGAILPGTAALVIALYIGFALVALAVDRRALLVSSLVYVLGALYALFERTGAVELAAALTALVIGSALLTLSAFWQPMRRTVVGALGSARHRLPPTHQPALA